MTEDNQLAANILRECVRVPIIEYVSINIIEA